MYNYEVVVTYTPFNRRFAKTVMHIYAIDEQQAMYGALALLSKDVYSRSMVCFEKVEEKN